MPCSLLQLRDQPQDLLLHRHVESRGRLVGDDQPRLGGEGGRNQHALAHAAGKLVRIGAHHALGVADMHLVEQLADAFVGLRRVPAEDVGQPVGHLRADAP